MKNDQKKTMGSKDKPNRPTPTNPNMDEREMNDLLVELHGMPHWQAIKRYYGVRNITAESSLCSIDPFKEPTLMARNQGIRIGLMDLPKYVQDQIEKRKKAEEEGS